MFFNVLTYSKLKNKALSASRPLQTAPSVFPDWLKASLYSGLVWFPFCVDKKVKEQAQAQARLIASCTAASYQFISV